MITNILTNNKRYHTLLSNLPKLLHTMTEKQLAWHEELRVCRHTYVAV